LLGSASPATPKIWHHERIDPVDLSPVDALIRQLQSVVDQAMREGSRIGYFASLYTRITIAVRRAIAAGTFDDGAAVVRLDLAFARRYLDAIDRFQRRDSAISPPWAVALGAVDRSDLAIVQQMALAMNAHINFDLGMATFDCFGARELWGARADFERVNTVLESVVTEVEREIAVVSPILRVLGGLSPKLATWLIDFGLVGARELAWRFAATLAGARDDSARGTLIDRHAHDVASLCGAITQDRIRNVSFRLIASIEEKDVRRVIRTFDRGIPPEIGRGPAGSGAGGGTGRRAPGPARPPTQ
jgi:hypothetical protein